MKAAVLLISILLPGLAMGAVCPPVEQVAGSVCEDNEPLGSQAIVCAKGFVAHVAQGQQQAAELIKAEAAAQASHQKDSVQKAGNGYRKAFQLVSQLRAEGFELYDILHQYHVNLAFPEDYDDPEMTGMSPEAYLKTQECLEVPHQALRVSKAMVKRAMTDLLKLRRSLASKDSTLTTRGAGFQGTVARPVSQAKGAGAPAAAGVKPKDKQGTSDLTGTGKAIEDAKRAKKVISVPPKTN